MNPRIANLAPLAGESWSEEYHFTTDTDGIVKICDADPNRWAVIVTSNQAGLNLVTTRPDINKLTGVGVPNTGPLELLYSKYLVFVQQRLFYITNDPEHDIEVVLIRVNAKG